MIKRDTLRAASPELPGYHKSYVAGLQGNCSPSSLASVGLGFVGLVENCSGRIAATVSRRQSFMPPARQVTVNRTGFLSSRTCVRAKDKWERS